MAENKGVVSITASIAILFLCGCSSKTIYDRYKMRTRSTSSKLITESTVLNIDILESIADFLGKVVL